MSDKVQSLKEKIQNNDFVDNLRVNNEFSENSFNELKESLCLLESEWQGKPYIDKELVADLFSINDAMYGYLAITEKIDDKYKLKDKVIDAWSEINDQITNCLY